MKILQICSARQLGGGERHLADLANSLVEKGHTIFAAVAPGSPLKSELTLLSEQSIRELPMRNSLDIFAVFKLARMIREFEIDVIHAHVARDYTLAAAASRLTGNTPYILTRHVLFPLKTNYRMALRRASKVIAVSEAVATALRQQKIFDASKIVTIHNGINTKKFAGKSGKRVNVSEKPFVVGMIGHIAPIKGQEDLLRAAATVIAQRGDVEFVLVGEDKSAAGKNRAAIFGLIEHLDLGVKVSVVGWLDDVREMLDTFDLFVSPSRSEPFGLVILEAMASGVPVVATRSEGAIEILEDGVTGMLVPIGKPNILAETILHLLDSPAECERLSANALKAVNEKFSLDKMVDATERVYHEATTADQS